MVYICGKISQKIKIKRNLEVNNIEIVLGLYSYISSYFTSDKK